ncbi:MAG: MlaD family protein [Bacteroidota bacterium]
MKLSSEAKIGIIGILTLAVLIWGINYLKGRNILTNTYSLHAYYSDAGGLESSAPVLMNGVKIGFIKELELSPGESKPIKVVLSIEKAYPIHKGSQAVLFSADLLGTKAIRIEQSGEKQLLGYNDTIQSIIEPDMLSSLQAQIMPVMQQISNLAVSLDSLTLGVDQLIDSEATRETMVHLSAISESLKTSLEPGGSLNQSFGNLESFTAMLKAQEEDVASLTSHLNSISQSVDSAGINKLSHELLAMTQQFSLILEQINSGQGNAGKFIYTDSLYLNLDLLISDLDELIRDLNENPEDYVHISLFGNSQKKKK